MGNNIKRAIRERMAKTGETYATARMHLLAAGSLPEGQVQGARPDDPPSFVYASHGPDGLPTGLGVLAWDPLSRPVMACDSCGWCSPQSMVKSARCGTPACKGSIYEWLHPDRVFDVRPDGPPSGGGRSAHSSTGSLVHVHLSRDVAAAAGEG